MSEQRLNTRVINKHDIEVNWLKAVNFIPKKGEIIVYDIEVDENGEVLKDSNENSLLPEGRTIPYIHERFKIGDGITNVNDLPFVKDLKNLNDGKGNGALEQLHDTESWTGIDADGNEVNYNTEASGKFSIIYGGKSYAEGGRSLAGGTKSVAKGSGSLAFGDTNYAVDYATAFGYQTRALGAYSHTEGRQTITKESNAHAEGALTESSGNSAHSEGQHTKAIGEASHAEGYNTEATASQSHSEGYYTKAIGENSHAEGSASHSTGGNSHAEGSIAYANGDNSHAEGESTIADGNASHAEGTGTKASQNQAHAEGWNTEASGYHSHSEGSETLASGNFSHAGGKGTIAIGEAQTAIGRYNEENSDALFIVGNGTASSRNNAFVVNADGTATIQTIGTNDNNVVSYKQLRNYVAANGGTSPWDEQNSLLFTEYEGKVTIYNSPRFEEGQGYIELGGLDRYYTYIYPGHFYISDLAGYDGLSIKSGNIYLEYEIDNTENYGYKIVRNNVDNVGTDEQQKTIIASLNITAEEIIYNDRTIYWEDIINTTNWRADNELLFDTGDIKITNHLSDTTASNGSITIGYDYALSTGSSYNTIQNDSIIIAKLDESIASTLTADSLNITDSSRSGSKIPTVQLSKSYYEDITNLKFTPESLYYKKVTTGGTIEKEISWERIIAAVEAIENAVDVSEVGQ